MLTRKLSIAVAVAALLGAGLAPAAFARILVNTIDPTAVVTDGGRQLVVTGPIGCTTGERAFLHVTVTQRTTGALAEGSTRVVCTGATHGRPTPPRRARRPSRRAPLLQSRWAAPPHAASRATRISGWSTSRSSGTDAPGRVPTRAPTKRPTKRR